MERNNQKASTLNSEWVTKSIEYHGQPLQKVWEGEHGIQSLQNIGVRNPDFAQYHARQKQFVFSDRAKRLKVHSFIAKKANELFATDPAKACARSNDLSIANSLQAVDGVKASSGETHGQSLKFIVCVYVKMKIMRYTLILGLFADMPPMSVFLPDNANRSNLIKKICSVCKLH